MGHHHDEAEEDVQRAQKGGTLAKDQLLQLLHFGFAKILSLPMSPSF